MNKFKGRQAYLRKLYKYNIQTIAAVIKCHNRLMVFYTKRIPDKILNKNPKIYYMLQISDIVHIELKLNIKIFEVPNIDKLYQNK